SAVHDRYSCAVHRGVVAHHDPAWAQAQRGSRYQDATPQSREVVVDLDIALERDDRIVGDGEAAATGTAVAVDGRVRDLDEGATGDVEAAPGADLAAGTAAADVQALEPDRHAFVAFATPDRQGCPSSGADERGASGRLGGAAGCVATNQVDRGTDEGSLLEVFLVVGEAHGVGFGRRRGEFHRLGDRPRGAPRAGADADFGGMG